jgi:hypothetical protein
MTRRAEKERTMEKKLQKSKALVLRKESIRQLESSGLKDVAGGGRLRVPIGRMEDTTPIYEWVDDTLD